MRSKVDENLPREVSDLLNRAGHDAISVGKQGLSGSDDAMIYGRCQQEKRALITLDVGFAKPAGVRAQVILRRDRAQAGAAGQAAGARRHDRLIAAAEREPLDNRLWSVEGPRVRIRG